MRKHGFRGMLLFRQPAARPRQRRGRGSGAGWRQRARAGAVHGLACTRRCDTWHRVVGAVHARGARNFWCTVDRHMDTWRLVVSPVHSRGAPSPRNVPRVACVQGAPCRAVARAWAPCVPHGALWLGRFAVWCSQGAGWRVLIGYIWCFLFWGHIRHS